MSEFKCVNGHDMSCHDQWCPKCGAPVARMDGFTNRQLREMERDWKQEMICEPLEEED